MMRQKVSRYNDWVNNADQLNNRVVRCLELVNGISRESWELIRPIHAQVHLMSVANQQDVYQAEMDAFIAAIALLVDSLILAAKAS